MDENKKFKIRLNKIRLVNFKCFDDITIEFLKPFNKDDLDVFVLGSQNGLGKTSVLEACALLFLSLVANNEMHLRHLFKELKHFFRRYERNFLSINDYFIKSGKSNCQVEGFFEIENEEYNVKLKITEEDFINCSENKNLIYRKLFNKKEFYKYMDFFEESLAMLLLSILPVSDTPFILSPFMYFNSNRKIKAGNPRLSDVLDFPAKRMYKMRREFGEDTMDTFKAEIIGILVGRGGVFEDFNIDDTEKALKFLNSLCKEYAGGTIEKLRRPDGESTELRITPTNGGESISFDGLSSGQKEIISTLFLIWKNTKDQPGIVLIDEPELHLNAEWQHRFVRTLKRLLPQNQYILTTHSKHIFGSVEPEYRGMLRPDNWEE